MSTGDQGVVRIAKMCVVDGAEVQVSAEGGSAKEALSYVEAAIEEIGAAPQGAPAAGGAPGKRSRRTKQEMEIARAAAAGGVPDDANGQPTLPGPMPPAAEPARVFGPPITSINVASGGTWIDGAVASFAPEPPVPLDGKTVGFDAPPPSALDEMRQLDGLPPTPLPPAPKTAEEALREQIDATLNATIALKPEWKDGVISAYQTYSNRHGGDIHKMHLGQLVDVAKGVEEYKARVEAHLRK